MHSTCADLAVGLVGHTSALLTVYVPHNAPHCCKLGTGEGGGVVLAHACCLGSRVGGDDVLMLLDGDRLVGEMGVPELFDLNEEAVNVHVQYHHRIAIITVYAAIGNLGLRCHDYCLAYKHCCVA